MNITGELVNTRRSSLKPGMSWPSEKPQRPSFRWSDIRKAPLHDFSIRDEILYQYLLAWAALGQVIRFGGDIFAAGSARDGILGRQIVIQAWK